MNLFYCKARVKRFSCKKLYKRLTLLNNEKSPNTKAIHNILSEIAKRDPVEYEAEKIEVEVEFSKRHAVRETSEILDFEIKYNQDYLDQPESLTDPYERKLRSAKLEMVQKELAHRKNRA